MSTVLKLTARVLGASLGLTVPAASLPAAVAQPAAATWYKDVVQVMDGDAPLDTGDGRPSRDGRWHEENRKGHAAPVFHDWTGDGLPDLIVGDFSGRFRLYANRGTRGAPAFNGYDWIQADGRDAMLHNFCCTATGVRFADIDGDGVDDLTAGSYLPGLIYWFPGEAGGLGPRQILTDWSGLPILARLDEAASNPYDNYAAKPAWMDWDGDGLLDMLIGDARGDLLVRRNAGPTRMEGLTARPRQPVFERGISTPDQARISVFDFIKDGGGKFADEEYLSPVAADWNGDGLTDLIVATQSGAAYLLLNVGSRGEPAFALPAQLLPPVPGGENMPAQLLRAGEKVERGARASVDVADWNGDGKLDLILGDWSRSLQLRGNLSASEERGLKRVLAKLVALDRKAGLDGEEPLRDRLHSLVYYENEKLAAELTPIEGELTAFLEPAGKERSTRLSDFERDHGYVRVYLRR
jgi:FG-GAP-like repeat